MPFIEVSEFVAQFEKMEVYEEKKQYVYQYEIIGTYFHEGKEQFLYKPVKIEVQEGQKEKLCLVAPNFFRQCPKKHSTTTLQKIHDRGVRGSENLEDVGRAVGRSENLGVPVLFGGHNLPPLVEIGLTDLPKSGGVIAPPTPPRTTSLGGAPSEPSVQLPLSMPVISYGEKQHRCSECSTSFTTKCNLNRHISMYHERKKKNIDPVHEQKKPFNCEICDYSCTQKDEMTQHVSSVHKKKKPFQCDICNYSCFLNHDIKKHFESVHEEKKSFKCDVQNEKTHIQNNPSNDGDDKESSNQLIKGFLKNQILLFHLAGGTPSALPVPPPLPKGQLISE